MQQLNANFLSKLTFALNFIVSTISLSISPIPHKNLALPTNLELRKYYSTSLIKNSNKLDPWMITGFVDGEGSFIISVVRNEKMKTGWRVKFFFSICLHVKDTMILERIKNSLRVGKICFRQTRETVSLDVTSINEIKIIIEHFEVYPLMTHKHADCVLFKEVIQIIINKEHLTNEGLEKIVAIKAKMNWGLSDILKSAFPDVQPVARPLVKSQTSLDPNWVAGFTSSEGCFFVVVTKSKTRVGFAVFLRFKITQHLRDKLLMISLIKYFNCGKVYQNRNAVDYRVEKFDDIVNKIIPFLKKHWIEGVKAQDFKDFCRVAELMKDKKHLTKEGLEEIKKIKVGMNKGRKLFPPPAWARWIKK